MLNIAKASLATSVSSSGGIGFIAGGYDTSTLEAELQNATNIISELNLSNKARQFYSQTGTLPLGVGFLNWGTDKDEALRTLERYPVAAVWLFAPREIPDLIPWVNEIRALGSGPKSLRQKHQTQIWIQVGSVSEAVYCLPESLHPDVLVIQGSDAGGHGLAHSASLMTLLPEIHSLQQSQFSTSVHLFAAGGISTGRGLLAAQSLGASGAILGTRFLACSEANIAKGYQDEILRAGDGGVSTVRSTVYDRVRGISGWPGRYNGRGVINRSYVDAVGGVSDEENRRLYGIKTEKGDEGWGVEGRMTTYVGTGVGLVKEVLGAREILEEIWEEAEGVMRDLALESR